jgi:Protein of unknown function (DUF2877)
MLTVRVSRWSQAAARLVHPQRVLVGRVHSCYARIINVQTPVGRLLTLQGEGSLQAPLALALATDIEALGAHLPVGALVVQDIPTATGYPAALRLQCAAVPVWDGSLQACPRLTPPVLMHIATTLTAWLCRYAPTRGLAPLARLCRRRAQPLAPLRGRSAFRALARLCRRRAQPFLSAHERDATGLSTTCAAVYPVLAPLLSGRHTFADTTLLTLVQGLVGLGEGLTPSGDDCLVGLLAVLHVTGYLPSLCAPAVRAQFCQYVRLGTSQLSGEFVRCALQGHFAEPVVRLMRALCTPDTGVWQTHAAELAAVGHSSGVDAMVGIALGCRLLA